MLQPKDSGDHASALAAHFNSNIMPAGTCVGIAINAPYTAAGMYVPQLVMACEAVQDEVSSRRSST